MKSLCLLCACVLFALLASCSEKDTFPNKFTDPRDGKSYHQMDIAGLTWMRENLQYQDSLYSYQQALSACPPGWSLPTKDDWAALGEFYGGYETYNAEVGSPSESYKVLIGSGYSGFGASKDYYWASTPAWADGPIVRSFSFGLDSISKRTILAGTSNSKKIYCRCVKRTLENFGENYAEFSLKDQVYRYDLHPTFFPKKYSSGKVALYLYKEIEGEELANRVMISVQLPGQYVKDGEIVNGMNPSFDHQVIGQEGYSVYSFGSKPETFKMDISLYDGKMIKGTFSGFSSGADAVEIAGGEFQLALSQDDGG